MSMPIGEGLNKFNAGNVKVLLGNVATALDALLTGAHGAPGLSGMSFPSLCLFVKT